MQKDGLRDRIVDFIRVKGVDILPHLMNPRSHPPLQRERLQALLEDVGIAGVLLVYRSARNNGALTLIDGELRSTAYHDTEWPCVVLDVTDSEADLLLATHDPIAALAEYHKLDTERMLLDALTTTNPVLTDFLTELATAHGIVSGEGPPTLGELERQYDEPDAEAFWPEIRLKVSPETFAAWEELFADLDGQTPDEKIRALCQGWSMDDAHD